MTSKLTLLCVDDEPNVLKSYMRALRGEDYQVITAESGTAALEILRDHPVHVIISDFRMPNMNGVEFLQAAQKIDPRIIRVILSGYADELVIQEALLIGEVSKFLLKPLDNAALKQIVNELFLLYKQKNPN